MIDTIDLLRRDRTALEAEIRAAGSTIRGTSCNCPHPDHKDEHPSASIHAGADGVWRVTCFSAKCFGDKGGDIFDLRATLTGKPLADILREARGADARKQTTSTAPPTPDMLTLAKRYTDAVTADQLGDLAAWLGVSTDALHRLRVGRCERDGAYSFPMRDADGAVVGIRLRCGDAKYAESGGHNGLFIPADLSGTGPLLIVEGPTDCAAALDMGFDAIGRANNNARSTDDLLADYLTRHPRDEVWIVTDRDPDGSAAKRATDAAAERLAARLGPLVPTVKVFAPPSPCKDVRAWRNAGATMDDLDAAADAAPSRGASVELREMLNDEICGKRRAIAWPHRLVTRGTQSLIPGTVTLVVGDPGSGKSLWLLQALAYWHDAGIRCAIFELEQSRAEHLKRALAQRVGAAWLTDLESVAAQPDKVCAYQAEHATWQDSFGRCIYDAPSKPVMLDDLVPWVEARAAEGARIIAVDPVTAAITTDQRWYDDQKFLQTVMPILDRHGASLVLVTHPKKGKQRATVSTLDDLAGGAAWQRFSQCILWLERHDEPRTVTVKGAADGFPLPTTAQINRTLRVMKARNGRGAGWQLAVDFDAQTLRFHERGAIVKTPAEKNCEAEL